MVSLALDSGTDELLTVVQEFAAEQIRDRGAEAEKAGAAPEDLALRLHEMGIAPAVATEFGGQGVPSAQDGLLVAERLAYGDAGVTLELLASNQAAGLIAAAGSPEQQAGHLRRLAAEPGLHANVLYYEGFGRGPSELETRAVRSAGGWTLSGRKIAAVRPLDAELSVVVTAAEEELAAFVLLPEQIAALRVMRDDIATGKLGLRAARTANVEFDGIQVADDQRLVPAHPLELCRAVALHRLLPAAMALGVGAAALDYATTYTRERIAWGQPVFNNQGVAFPLSDVAITLDAARLTLLAAANDVPGLDDPGQIERRTTSAVHQAHRTALNATRVGVNSLGGHGYLVDHPVERWYRAASTLAAMDFDPLAADNETI